MFKRGPVRYGLLPSEVLCVEFKRRRPLRNQVCAELTAVSDAHVKVGVAQLPTTGGKLPSHRMLESAFLIDVHEQSAVLGYPHQFVNG